MGSLSNLYISQSYQSLIHLATNNTASATLIDLQDGLGNSIGVSVNTGGDLSLSGSLTASLTNGYVWVGNGNNKTSLVATSSFGGGGSTDISSLNAFTASQNTKNATLAGVTASLQGQLTNIGSQSSSWDNTSLNTFSASANTQLANLSTSQSIDNQKWINISTQSGSWGVSSGSVPAGTVSSSAQIVELGFLQTSSFQIYTGSQDTKNTTLASVTSSLNSATASLFTSASLGLVTASISGQLLTFTKGNTTQFTLNIPTGSGTYITGSYGAFSDFTTQSGSANTAYKMKFNTTDVSDGVILSGSTGLKVSAYGTYNLQWSGQLNEGAGGETTSVWLRINGVDVVGSRGDVTVPSNTNQLPSWNYFLTLNQNDVVELMWSSTGANTTWAFSPATVTPTRPSTASLIATLARVDVGGGTNSVSTTIFNQYTSSINSYTASTNLWTSSIDSKFSTLGGLTGSYATTGSNTFRGNQTLEDPASNASTLVPTSGSFMLVAKSYTSASSHITGSPNLVNLIFKDNNNTGDTILSGSNNIFGNPVAPTAGFKRFISNGNIALFGALPQLSSSMAFTASINGNFIQTQATNILARGPVSASAWTIAANLIQGSMNFGTAAATHAEGLKTVTTVSSNYVQGILNIIANQSALTSSVVTIASNNIAGLVNMELSSSAINFSNNIINDAGFILRNQYYSSSVGLGQAAVSRNNFGGLSQTVQISGSLPTGTTNSPQVVDNVIFGGANTIYSDVANARTSGTTAYHSAKANLIAGTGLFVSASSLITDATSFGSAFVGRYNATDNKRSKTSDNVFVVGTGTSTAATKTGFLIDSGSNSYFEGTLSVSGSTSISGALNLTGSAYGNVVSMSITSNTASMNLAAGNYFELTASVTPLRIEVSNLRGGVTSTLSLSGSTASTITFGSNVLQPTGSAYTASVAGQTDILSFVAFNSSKVNVVSTINMV